MITAPLRAGAATAPPAEKPRPLSWNDSNRVQMTQYKSPLLPDGDPPPTMHCGPTSALMAVRSLGMDIGPFDGARTQKAIDGARLIGTGTVTNEGTYPWDVANMIASTGLKVGFSANVDHMLGEVRQGNPVLLVGDASAKGSWAASSVPPGIVGRIPSFHFVAVTGYEPKTRQYVVNDPGFTKARLASRAEIEAFNRPALDVWKQMSKQKGEVGEVFGKYYKSLVIHAPEGGRKPINQDPPAVKPLSDAAAKRNKTIKYRDQPDGSAPQPPLTPASPAHWNFLDSQHMTAYQSYTNPGAPTSRAVPTGPVAALVAAKLAGYWVPGARSSMDAVNRIHKAATGSLDRTPHAASGLRRAFTAMGAPTTLTTDVTKLLTAARAGVPVMLRGSSMLPGTWDGASRSPRAQVREDNEWITVFGFDRRLNEYYVSSPAMQVPMHVPEEQLRDFHRKSDEPGIIVGRG